jgi:hypothetical protein
MQIEQAIQLVGARYLQITALWSRAPTCTGNTSVLHSLWLVGRDPGCMLFTLCKGGVRGETLSFREGWGKHTSTRGRCTL